MCGGLPSFKTINDPHERIHSLAKEAPVAARSGDRPKAEKLFRDVEKLSGTVKDLLVRIKTEYLQSGNGKH